MCVLFVSADDCRFLNSVIEGLITRAVVAVCRKVYGTGYRQHYLMKERITRKKRENHIFK